VGGRLRATRVGERVIDRAAAILKPDRPASESIHKSRWWGSQPTREAALRMPVRSYSKVMPLIASWVRIRLSPRSA
jgi:hypothetical protein